MIIDWTYDDTAQLRTQMTGAVWAWLALEDSTGVEALETFPGDSDWTDTNLGDTSWTDTNLGDTSWTDTNLGDTTWTDRVG